MSTDLIKQDYGGGSLSNLARSSSDNPIMDKYINSCSGDSDINDPKSLSGGGGQIVPKNNFSNYIFKYLEMNNNLYLTNNIIIIIRNDKLIKYKITIKRSNYYKLNINKLKETLNVENFTFDDEYIILENTYILDDSIKYYLKIETEIINILKNIYKFANKNKSIFQVNLFNYSNCYSSFNTITEIIQKN